MAEDPPPVAVDAHHHVWDPARHDHAWLDDPALAPLRRRFTVADHVRAAAGGIAGRPVVASVLVQSLADLRETRDLLAVAAQQPTIGAVVGWVDLTRPDVGDVLDELRAGPGGHLLRGVRHLVQDEPDPGWLARPDVRRGLRTVAESGLTYDALVRPPQLRAVVDVARDLPALTLVLDHAGKPDLTTGHLTPGHAWPTASLLEAGDLGAWADDLRRLAAHPQIRCKISGLVTEAPWHSWRSADLDGAVALVLDAFSPQRCMFGSDWPVCLLAAGWDEWAAAAADLLSGLTPDELDAVLRGTAIDTYHLEAIRDQR